MQKERCQQRYNGRGDGADVRAQATSVDTFVLQYPDPSAELYMLFGMILHPLLDRREAGKNFFLKSHRFLPVFNFPEI
jgi:hypothetical protein